MRLEGLSSLYSLRISLIDTDCQHIFTTFEYLANKKGRLDLVTGYVSHIKIHAGWGSVSDPHPAWTFKKKLRKILFERKYYAA